MSIESRLKRIIPAAFLLAAAAAGAQQPVRVSSARELLRAVAPNTTLVLAPGDYDLSRARDVRSRYVSWQGTEAGQDFEVVISGVAGLTLRAEQGDVLFAMDEETEEVSLPGTLVTGNEVERFDEDFEEYYESAHPGDYPAEAAGEPDDLGLDLPEGWIPGVDEGWPGAVFLVQAAEDLAGMFVPLEVSAAAADLRTGFRQALEALRQAFGRQFGRQLQVQAGSVRAVSEGEYRQEVSGTSRDDMGVDTVRGQILRAGDSYYATIFLGSAPALDEYAEELAEVRAALEVLIGE